MKVRPASPDDCESIKALYRTLFSEMAELSPEYWRAAEQDEAFIKAQITGSGSEIFVAEDEVGNICAFAAVREEAAPQYPCFVQRRFAFITDLCTAREKRGRGAAKALIAAVKEWAGLRGLEYIELNVLSANHAALRLYAEAGFREESVTMRSPL